MTSFQEEMIQISKGQHQTESTKCKSKITLKSKGKKKPREIPRGRMEGGGRKRERKTMKKRRVGLGKYIILRFMKTEMG